MTDNNINDSTTCQANQNNDTFSPECPKLLKTHYEHLRNSGISLEVIKERGYESILGKRRLKELGFSKIQQRTPGILMSGHGTDGKPAGCQYRPDNPRLNSQGKAIKYETPRGSSNRLDVPPRCLKDIGDPSKPLWITEGCKKADSIATRGECALNLPGVWSFRGKNEVGGITFLADWDYVALNDRTVYQAFDSDIITKELVKKALQRLNEHLQRKGAKVFIVHLPQNGADKIGIDDYLAQGHTLDEAVATATPMEDFGSEKNEERFVPGFILPDGTIGEMVVDRGKHAFVIACSGSVRKVEQYEAGGVTYIPYAGPLIGTVVHFATTAALYDSQATLLGEIKAFIHRYVEVSPEFESISSLYVLLSWVFEFAPSVPYLRVLGDWGSGKTRFLDVVGRVCFRPMFVSGATTTSPIFRILDKFQGTLILDEADFKDSAAWAEIIKILNNGYRPGFPVLRSEKGGDGRWYPQAYQVFAPKLIATRFPFKDEALESRCFTTEMMPLTREDIPRVLPPSFYEEVEDLRSKLLTFRLANLLRLKGRTFGNDLVEVALQARLQEILIPLKAMVNGDLAMSEALTKFIKELQTNLLSERRESVKGKVLAAIIELHRDKADITAGSIASRINEQDSDSNMTAEKVGWRLRQLGFKKDRTGKGRVRLVLWDESRVTKLAKMYGLEYSPASLSTPEQPGPKPLLHSQPPLFPQKPSELSELSANSSYKVDSADEADSI